MKDMIDKKVYSFSIRAQRPPSRAIGGVVAVGQVDVPRRFGPAMPPRAQDVAFAGVVYAAFQHLAHASAGEQLVVLDQSQHQLGCQLICAKRRLLWVCWRQRMSHANSGRGCVQCSNAQNALSRISQHAGIYGCKLPHRSESTDVLRPPNAPDLARTSRSSSSSRKNRARSL